MITLREFIFGLGCSIVTLSMHYGWFHEDQCMAILEALK